jgi:hypothetical protein
MWGDQLPVGRYDAVITDQVRAALPQAEAEVAALDAADVPARLGAHIGELVARRLATLDSTAHHPLLSRLLAELDAADDRPVDPPAVLRAVHPAASSTSTPWTAVGPDIPLGVHDLLVNAHGEPNLGTELAKELRSADRVDLIVAFIRW